jgi:hypothetical protein
MSRGSQAKTANVGIQPTGPAVLHLLGHLSVHYPEAFRRVAAPVWPGTDLDEEAGLLKAELSARRASLAARDYASHDFTRPDLPDHETPVASVPLQFRAGRAR